MSRVGKNPIQVPSGVDIKVDGSDVTVKGPKGELKRRFHERVSISVEDGVATVRSQRRDSSVPGPPRAVARPPGQHGHGRVRRLPPGTRDPGRRLPGPVEGKDLELQVGYSHSVTIPRRPASPSRCPSPPRCPCPASTRRWSARSRPTCARSVPPSPTRARESATSASTSAARRGRQVSDEGFTSRGPATAPQPGPAQDRRHRRSARVSRCSAATDTYTPR
jgi:hypothetical protein